MARRGTGHARPVSVPGALPGGERAGQGGIGKSALVVSAMHRLTRHFQLVLFRSLRHVPSCKALLEECLQGLVPQPLDLVAADLERRLSLLLEYLRKQRMLLVFDNLEALLLEGEARGHLRPGYDGYTRLLRRVVETAQIARTVNATVIPLERAPEGYKEFNKGATKKFVLSLHRMITA